MTTAATVRTQQYIAHENLSALIRYLKCGNEAVRLHVADDGSSDKEYINTLMVRACNAWGTQPSFSDSGGAGLGAALNRAMEWVEPGDLWAYIPDDWCLTRHLYLDRAALFVRVGGYDMVRLGPIHPDLACTTKYDATLGWWLEIHQSIGGLAFAMRPFLATPRLVVKCGEFPEVKPWEYVEMAYAARIENSDIKIASINMRGPWKHLGRHGD